MPYSLPHSAPVFEAFVESPSRHLTRDLGVTVGTLSEEGLETGPVVGTRPDPLQQALLVEQPSTFGVLIAGLVGHSAVGWQLEADCKKRFNFCAC